MILKTRYTIFTLVFLISISILFMPHSVVAPRIPGLLERIQQPLYDRNTASDTPALNFFQIPLGGNSVTVKSDPAGHAQYIRLLVSKLTIVTSAGEVAIVAPAPWVNMSGTITGDGAFSISGRGTVAGYPNILSTMGGTFSQNNLEGDLVMGGDGTLPTQQSITYHVKGIAQQETIPSGTSEQSSQPNSGNGGQPSPDIQNFKIPTWIKNNAKWWASGEIEDSEMIQGLQYLISDGIMVIPSTTSSATGSQEIPTWVKNNAKWWAESQIGDSDFVKGVQYLISNGIINIQPEKASGAALLNISPTTVQINLGKTSYATVSGKIQNYQRGDTVTLIITRPDHTTLQLTIFAAQTGYFTTPLEFDKSSMQGTYSIMINYGGQSIGPSIVNVGKAGTLETPVFSQHITIVNTNTGAIGCAGGGEGAPSHNFTWWNTQKNQFTLIEENMTILKQPTNTACGPTVGAVDLLHWNATIAPGIVTENPADLIKRLMALMHYKDGWGTTNMTIASGLSEYINSTGNGKKLIVSVYGKEYENGTTTNTNRGTVHLIHSDTINSTVLQNTMVQKSNVLVIIQSPDGTRSHVMKLLAFNGTRDSEGFFKVSFIDTQSGGIITEYLDENDGITYEGKTWYIVNIITVTPTGSK